MRAQRLRSATLLLLLTLPFLAAACADRGERRSASPLAATPVPTSVAPAPGASGAAGTSAMAGAAGPAAGRPVLLPSDPVMTASDVAFPGRDQSFAFRQELERKYRDGLRRQATTSHVDVEGDLVWTQEYLRYRVNLCGHVEALQRVLSQVDGAPPPPLCGSVAASATVAFPPRSESLLFRQELERKYRDGLGRAATATFVDVEGAIVWTQEYLRYRVNACGHVAATQKVLDQIDGRGIAATCSGDMSGVWVGEITNYVSNPFVMDLVQTSTTVVGSYTDRTSSGFFTGALIGERFTGRVNLGDTALLFEGKWYGADVVNGDLIGGGGIGRRSFEMRRQR